MEGRLSRCKDLVNVIANTGDVSKPQGREKTEQCQTLQSLAILQISQIKSYLDFAIDKVLKKASMNGKSK